MTRVEMWAHTSCHVMSDVSGRSLLKQQSVPTAERERNSLESHLSHLSSWNPVECFWTACAFCECGNAGNVTGWVSRQPDVSTCTLERSGRRSFPPEGIKLGVDNYRKYVWV